MYPISSRRYTEGLFILWILISTNVVRADTGQDFLTSIIGRLKEERPSENHQLFYNELLKASSRSADEYQIHENQAESGENAALYPAGNELDFNQNALQPSNLWSNEANNALQPSNLWPNEANSGTGNNNLNSQLVNFYTFPYANVPVSTSFQQTLTDQPFAFNNFPNLPSQQPLQPQNLIDSAFDSTTEGEAPLSLHDNTGPNLFNSANDATGTQQSVRPTYNFPEEQVNDAQQLTLPALLLNQGLNAIRNGPLQSAYNYYNAAHGIDDNLIDNAISAMSPYTGEHSISGPHKQFMVEPLFVAMAGFVGVAMIFMSAILFLPKLLTPPPHVSSLKGPQELAALTKLAVQTIEGNDCTERIACEVGRAMRGLHVSGKPIEVLEVLVSKNIASQLAQIRKAMSKKQVCRLIQCKPLKSIGYSAADKSKSAIEPKLPKIASDSPSLTIKPDKMKQKPNNKEKQSPPEPRIEPSTTRHSVVKKTLKTEKDEVTTKISPTTVVLKLS